MSRTRQSLFTIARAAPRIAGSRPVNDLKNCNNMNKNCMIEDYAESRLSAKLE
jgi:hypothetical protein